MRQFGRNVVVTIGGLSPFTLDATGDGNAIQISCSQSNPGPRIRFDVKKNSGKHPNKCTIKITNLSDQTRNQIEKKPKRVILYAGFGDAPRLLFDGDLKRAWTEREGKADLVTEIHVGDGHRGYQFGRLEKAYRPPVNLRAIVQDAAKTMGVAIPPEILRNPVLSQTLSDGFSSSDLTRKALTDVLSRFNLSWSVQNRQLVILSENQARDGRAFVIDDTTGLTGSPKFKESENGGKGAKTEITFSHLLYPELLPGDKVQLNTQFMRHLAKITDVTSKGDSLSGGNDFLTEVTAKPIT